MAEPEETLSRDEGIALKDVLERAGMSALAAVIGKWLDRANQEWPPAVVAKLKKEDGGLSPRDRIAEALDSLDAQIVDLKGKTTEEADDLIRERLDELVQLLSSDSMPATIRRAAKGNRVGGDRFSPAPDVEPNQPPPAHEFLSPESARFVSRGMAWAFSVRRGEPRRDVPPPKERDKSVKVWHSEKTPKEGDNGLQQAKEQILKHTPVELTESDLTADDLRKMADALREAALAATAAELDSGNPTVEGANWYFEQFKDREIDDAIRLDLAAKGKKVRNAGMTILYEDKPCTLGTVFLKASGSRFLRVRETGASSKNICLQLAVPAPLHFAE